MKNPLLFLPFALVFTSCVTTTTTYPDGRVVKTNSSDPAIVTAVIQGATTGATIYLNRDHGLLK